MNDCENKLFKNINDIIKRWSILTSNFGYELIERDFERKYPQCRDKLIVSRNWHFEKLYKLLKKNLSTGDRLNEILMKSQSLDLNSKTILQIWISLALLAPKSTKVSTKTDGGRRRVWKPTIAESRDGILVHCKIFGDIEQMCINKQNKMSQMNLTMQPFVIVVGPEVTSIEKVYLRIDKIMYEMPSVLKAIDVLFKIFITFNACYPKECENFWYLIQWDVYEIRTASDQKIPFVCNILHDLKQG
ncbi:Uncharacterized protein DBV15_12392 [Temnothorax longispinosus]|uniref:Uncharacterized protein n=2 Tax=Temnothorax longispinosus TaxID=300112 RepID=A0A4S2KN34_9HYME|nr:Uncharacterized protein DBV15_12392 [Temnothorax longispinosus]